jgi:hypothetical protein
MSCRDASAEGTIGLEKLLDQGAEVVERLLSIVPFGRGWDMIDTMGVNPLPHLGATHIGPSTELVEPDLAVTTCSTETRRVDPFRAGDRVYAA